MQLSAVLESNKDIFCLEQPSDQFTVRRCPIKWAQDEKNVFVQVNLTGPKNITVDIKEKELFVQCTQGDLVNDVEVSNVGEEPVRTYECFNKVTPVVVYREKLDLPFAVCSEKSSFKVARTLDINLVKKDEESKWTQLHTGRKLQSVVVDWSRWVDSDAEDEPNAMDMGGDFGGMDGLAGLGGMPGMEGLGGMPGMEGLAGLGGMPGMEGLGGMPGMEGLAGLGGMQGLGGLGGMPGMEGLGGCGNSHCKDSACGSSAPKEESVVEDITADQKGVESPDQNEYEHVPDVANDAC